MAAAMKEEDASADLRALLALQGFRFMGSRHGDPGMFWEKPETWDLVGWWPTEVNRFTHHYIDDKGNLAVKKCETLAHLRAWLEWFYRAG